MTYPGERRSSGFLMPQVVPQTLARGARPWDDGSVPTVFATAVLLAHQSDWLAMVLVAIPLALFALILGIANRRADRDGAVDMTPPPPKSHTDFNF